MRYTPGKKILTGSYDFGGLAIIEGNLSSFTVTIPGAALGDVVDVLLPQPFAYGVAGLLSAEVTTANTVTVWLRAEYSGSDVEYNNGQTAIVRILK